MGRHMLPMLALLCPGVLALVVFAPPAAAITGGQVDINNTYSDVGCLVGAPPDGSGPFVNGSGTLVTPSAFLTAGHITLWLENLLDQYPGALPYLYVSFAPCAFDRSDPSTWRGISGVVTHPDYVPGANARAHLNDVGVLVLEEPFGDDVPLTPPPPLGLLDELKRQRVLRTPGEGGGAAFRVVGYGSMPNWPPPVNIPGDGWRRFADSSFLNVLQGWLLLRQNLAPGDGGTGYGDSGGPVFWTGLDGTQQVLVGETTWGDPNLVAMNSYQRLDLPETLDFINGVIAQVDAGLL